MLGIEENDLQYLAITKKPPGKYRKAVAVEGGLEPPRGS